MFLFLLERTWIVSVVEVVVGKAVVASALFASLRYLKKLQVAVQQETDADQLDENPISDFPSTRPRNGNLITLASQSPEMRRLPLALIVRLPE